MPRQNAALLELTGVTIRIVLSATYFANLAKKWLTELLYNSFNRPPKRSVIYDGKLNFR